MAKKKQELFIDINTQRDFNYILDHNKDQLICIEVYCSFAGPSDEVEALSRFRDQSQPVYLFILLLFVE
ncbi:unnamed protein product [Leptidea sinapis]|uniref:Uncharacterized protein n=1 Tax=Leptidea sinapis TaxID=189913 RepID=A0A5E4Q8H2_9NEOP|nr:unnamed protein product [Leptidea sinapis]